MPKIFESPDGGRTVRGREAISSAYEVDLRDQLVHRVLTTDLFDEFVDWHLMTEAAAQIPALRAALDQCRLIYTLSREE